ncbi:MAG: Ig-like domain-containing protein [Phocaeicola sp.]|nr:Ig-like domain-containing protein [Phocaeicola sp.]
MKRRKYTFNLVFLAIVLIYSCASPGTPDGGPFDETPPRFLGSSPRPGETANKSKKITMNFDEIVKIERAAEKVIISPPQLEQADIKANGRRIQVELFDTLKPNTTYTIDFSDAIVDNNEGNPLGNFAFMFSTGDVIDTMEVSGTVLNAEDLEPIKGISVGLHANLDDSAFVKMPFERISRTDSRGRFTIRGIAPGKYHIFALMDGNQNFQYDSKTEMIAFSDSLIVPSSKPDVRQDTIWADSLIIDTIKTVNYTHYYPDNIILRAFKAEDDRQYLKNSERDKLNHFVLVFNAKADTLPEITGLNFDSRDAFVVETTSRNDSICYWIKDSLLCEQDTLMMQLKYLATDTLNQLSLTTDTIYITNKQDKAQRQKAAEQAKQKEEKERKKKSKRGEKADSITVIPFLNAKVDAPSTLELGSNISISFDEPVVAIDTSAIHLQVMVDSLWQDLPYIFEADTVEYRKYWVIAPWKPEKEYQFSIDSLAFKGLYGLYTKKIKETSLKTKAIADYGTIFLNLPQSPEYTIVELMEGDGKIVRRQPISNEKTADFYFLPAGKKYYLRLFYDKNKNGVWDAGSYEQHQQPEEVYYYPKSWEMKANFEFEETWIVDAVPWDRQKLDEIKKQKPEETKKVANRNAERLKRLGRNRQ